MKAGTRLRGWGGAELIVVRADDGLYDLTCAGRPVAGIAQDLPGPATVEVTDGEQIQLGKRYTDGANRLELLCTKPGPGPLAVGGERLTVKAAKPLPSSD
jgi:hypothetical protein